MELINQPFTGQLGNRLIELLDSQDYDILNIVGNYSPPPRLINLMKGDVIRHKS